MKNQSKTTGFRAEPELRAAIEERANNLGITVAEFVKQCVIAELRDQGAKASAFEAFLSVQKAIHQMRIDVAISTEALLIAAGTLDEPEAHEWVNGNLVNRRKASEQ